MNILPPPFGGAAKTNFRRALLALVAVLITSLTVSGAATSGPVGDCTPGSDWGMSRDDFAAQVFDLVNAHRTSKGLRPLKPSPTLTAAAVWKARHMAKYQYMAHDDPAPPLARSTSQRVEACGYRGAGWGENVAYGYSSPQMVMNGWLNSPGHRSNIEHPSFTVLGVGAAAAGAGTLYWAQVFGITDDSGSATPPPPAPVTPPPAPVTPPPAPVTPPPAPRPVTPPPAPVMPPPAPVTPPPAPRPVNPPPAPVTPPPAPTPAPAPAPAWRRTTYTRVPTPTSAPGTRPPELDPPAREVKLPTDSVPAPAPAPQTPPAAQPPAAQPPAGQPRTPSPTRWTTIERRAWVPPTPAPDVAPAGEPSAPRADRPQVPQPTPTHPRDLMPELRSTPRVVPEPETAAGQAPKLAPAAPATQLVARKDLFRATMLVVRKDTGARVTSGQVKCEATVAGRTLRVVVNAFKGRRATCAWRVPEWADGETITGVIRVRAAGAHAKRAFSDRVAL